MGELRRRSLPALLILGLALPVAADVPPFDYDARIAAQKLRTFCKACHGVGHQRFIHDSSDERLWRTIFTENAPVSKTLWARRILRTLSWPSDDPPPFDQMMQGSHDWMPKGIKRLELSDDIVGQQPTRQFLVELLWKSLE